MSNPLIKVQTDNAPAPKGPYSQGVLAGDYLEISGQLPIDAATGKVVEADAKMQTAKVIDNIEAILSKQGIGLDRVVFTLLTVSDLGLLPEVNEAYAERFKYDPQPARHTSGGTLPKGMMVEISCRAYVGK